MNFKKTMGLTAAISALSASGIANADIELGDGLSVMGFVDMSYFYSDVDGADESEIAFAVDQVETTFLYSGKDGISAQVDIEYGESGTGNGEDETFVEQAFITKQVTDNLSITGGRFLSYTGWETEEPTGLFQYSGTGYGGIFYGGYQQGVTGMYDGDGVDFMVSFVNDAFNPINSDRESVEVELGIAVQPSEGLTAKLFYIQDDGNDTDLVNFWTSYEVSNWTFAFEYNTGEYANDAEADGFLLMANVASGDWAFTARYHSFEVDDTNGTFIDPVFGTTGATSFENSAITLAPSYVLSDNLLAVFEVRLDETDINGASVDSTSAALEALFTF